MYKYIPNIELGRVMINPDWLAAHGMQSVSESAAAQPETSTAQTSAAPLVDSEILDKLSNVFAQYEIRKDLIPKLLKLGDYKINFVIDDSDPMIEESDIDLAFASKFIQNKNAESVHPRDLKKKMTRWEEAENRLHVMIEILQYLPTSNITVSFLNRSGVMNFNRQGKTAEEFGAEAHGLISQAFQHGPSGSNAKFEKLSEGFRNQTQPTMHYLFTDGLSAPKAMEVINKRPNPQQSPCTLVVGTDSDEASLMHEVEYVAEVDDFRDEVEDLKYAQAHEAERRAQYIAEHNIDPEHAKVCPFLNPVPEWLRDWRMRQLLFAPDPRERDALDKPTKFSRETLEKVRGNPVSNEEYERYLNAAAGQNNQSPRPGR